MRKVFRSAVTVLLGVVAATVAAATPAHASVVKPCDTTPTWYYIKNVETGLYLEVQGGSTANNAKVIQNNKASGAQRQAWQLWKDASGNCILRSATTSSWKAISITGSGKADDVKAIQYTYIPGNTNEEWTAHLEVGSSEWFFENKNSGKYLEIPGPSYSPGVQADQYSFVRDAENEAWKLSFWP